jgi:hypothetical protein
MDGKNSELALLLPALDPDLVQTLPVTTWQQIPPDLVCWLRNNALTYPWTNQLALAAAVHSLSGVAHPTSEVRAIHSWLRYAIPDLYPDLASLDPEQALLRYMSDPLQPRVGKDAYGAYRTLQNKMQRYLAEAGPAIGERLGPFLFPPLIVSARLEKLVKQKQVASAQHRKNQVFDITKKLSGLVALAKRRYHWLANLENQVQHIARQVETGEITLPLSITVPHPEQQETLTFRVWSQVAWVTAHPDVYAPKTLSRHRCLTDTETRLFLQLEGNLPEGGWFLPALTLGIIQGSAQLEGAARQYTDRWQLPNLNAGAKGLLAAGPLGLFLMSARQRATGRAADSKVIFCVEPLLAAATVGLFVLVSIVSTGIRVGELQQLTYDQNCIERGYLPQFDDQSRQWVQGPERTFWRVYPKGSQRRARYFVSETMLETLLALHDLHRRYHGPLKSIPAQANYDKFSHTRRFPEQYRFVLQWAGRHLSAGTLNKCLTFLLLDHPCRDPTGQPVRITPHLLRHAMAGWLHQEDFSLDQIMGILKHVNGAVTTYYATLSPDELYRKLGPLLTSLAELVDLDPAVVRSGEQLRDLQEQALKRYGLLRQIPGGTCTTLYPCEVHFKCADCCYYLPDPARRGDIEQKVATGSEVIQFYRHQGEHLLAEAEGARQRSWQRVLTELDQIEEYRLMSPQTVADRMHTFPVNDVGPRLLQDSDPVQLLED